MYESEVVNECDGKEEERSSRRGEACFKNVKVCQTLFCPSMQTLIEEVKVSMIVNKGRAVLRVNHSQNGQRGAINKAIED